jgi:Secretion system C-terminal sorting domain
MKKIYLLALATVFAIGANAQDAAQTSKMKHDASEITTPIGNVVKRSAVKKSTAKRTPVWTDDFSNPNNWVISSPNGPGSWVIGQSIPAGTFAIPAITSTTAANGFALFDSDLDCSGNQVTNLTTKFPINLDTQAGVLLRFEQYYRRFFDSTFVYVSNDSINWVKFEVNVGLVNNDFSALDVNINPDIQELNISSVAANQDSVWIRFQFFSPSSLNAQAGCGYAWMIDDVAIDVPPAVDAELSNLEFTASGCGLSATDTIAAIVKNMGTQAISGFYVNYLTFDGVSIISSSSQKVNDTLASGATARIEFATTADFSAVGQYLLLGWVDSLAADANGLNDTLFAIIDNVQPIVVEPTYTQGFEATDDLTGWVVFDGDGDAATWTLSTASPRTGTSCASKAASATNNDWLFSNCIDMVADSSYTLSMYIRPGAVNTVQNFEVTIGSDANPAAVINTYAVPNPSAAAYTLVKIPLTIPSSGLYNIGLHITSSASAPTFKIDDIELTTQFVGLNNAKLDAKVDVFPNPANNNVTVSIRHTEEADYTVTITDLLGRTIKTVNADNVSATDLNIDLSTEANGVYLVKVQSGNAVKSSKLVINR